MKIQTHKPLGLWTKKGRLRSGLIPLLAMGCLLSTVGCSSLSSGLAPYSDSGSRLCTSWRARATALAMWREQYSHCYANAANSRDIRKGFVDGFIDTAAGGSGCTPLVPPSCCCGITKRVNAKCWFQGYPLGVAAAQSSGASGWSKTAISPDLAACMASNQCTPGCVPCSQNAGVMHSGMLHGNFDEPPVPLDFHDAPEFIDPNGPVEQGVPTPVQESFENRASDESEEMGDSTQDASSQENVEGSEEIDLPKDASPDSLDIPKGEVEEISPSDRDAVAPPAPVEPIEPDADLTSNQPEETLVPRGESSIGIRVESQEQGTPVVGDPITMPSIEESPQASATEVKPLADVAMPVVGEPVDLPNIQVSFDMEGVDWLFGEVDIAQAVLTQTIEGSL